MKVVVATSDVLAASHPRNAMADHVATRLLAAGHAVERLRIPILFTPQALPSQLAMMRMIEIEGADHLAAFDMPSGLLRVANRTLWLGAQGAPSDFTCGFDQDGDAVRVAGNAHRMAFTEASSIITSSTLVAAELAQSFGVTARVVPSEINLRAQPPHDGPSGPIVVFGDVDGRHCHHALLTLLRTNPTVRLRFVGFPVAERYVARIHARARRLGVASRITWTPGPHCLDAATIRRHLEDAPAVICCSRRRDWAVDHTADAIAAGVPAIVTEGPLSPNPIRNGRTGWVVSGTPRSFQRALDDLSSAGLRRALGDAGAAELRARTGNATADAILESLR